MQDEMNDYIESVYVKMITPEIDYSTVSYWQDLIVAGVPTLLHINEQRRIDAFYFDSAEINALVP